MTMNFHYFEYSDAWLLNSLFMYDLEFKELILTNVIANGDALNHSIFTLDELNIGFNKLIDANLIQFRNNSIRLTELGVEIKTKASKDKGGFFQRIENSLNRLRNLKISSSNVSKHIFFSERDLENAYNSYKK